MFSAFIRKVGPFFDFRARRAVKRALQESQHDIAGRGVDLVLLRLGTVLREPTGYYESEIQTERVGGEIAVTDGDVIYGPWLEGVGSRNRTTRFKGYFTFRLVHQQLEREAGGITERVFVKYTREMN